MNDLNAVIDATSDKPVQTARNIAAIADGPTLPGYVVREIAARAGRGWYFADKPRVAMSRELQELRLATYNKVVPIAQAYAKGVDGMSHRTRDAIWAHVCAECDIRWHAEHPDSDQAAGAMDAVDAFAVYADPDVQQAFVAWAAHRASGGQERFEPWRQEWLKAKEAKDGTHP
jgi:hypothetical protein